MLAGRRVLLGVTGGIAAYKVAHLARLLVAAGADVRVVMTESATRFVGPDTFAALTGKPVHTSLWEAPGTVLHVRIAHETDLAIVAPATANVIAKLARGVADDLLTSTLLEASCAVVVAPAMHTGMWEHPATRENVQTLEGRGVSFAGPAWGPLAAGDSGVGRMAEPEEILSVVEAVAARASDLAGRRILVTAGPTQEPIDPVRFVGNRSSGKMGIAIAREAAARGAEVTLVLGPGTVDPPASVSIVRVETAAQMRDAAVRAFAGSDALVMAAAVADFRPVSVVSQKIKKESGLPTIELEPTADILRELAELRSAQLLVGFAAETTDLEAAGRRKLEAKDLDLIVVNEVGREGTGFGSETNDAMILSRAGDDEPLRTWTKAELASAICDRLAKLLG
ncbi:MAG TPA: bifunctional phosphopantothenoylcysteine decarboxylase/phosphopantothenate--cysteine ligase CoaBC [Actinomycetota bacterium]|nr:bifunctional phosphopantothenoylcysteine decarboxylase/phosphopantothenate--cysteine ligase CoaBC [Actinomycetota bacterium]